MIKLCTFDLDGTTADTIKSIRYYVNIVLSEYGYAPIPTEEFPQYVGAGGRAMFEKLQANLGFAENWIDTMFARWKELYAEGYTYLTEAFPGIPELLRDLRAAGIHTAILTNKADHIAKGIAKALFGDSVEATVGDYPGGKLKPDPTNLLALCRQFGAAPAECLHVGDSLADIAAAKNAGTHSCAVSWGYVNFPTLQTANPDFSVHNAAEILQCVQNV